MNRNAALLNNHIENGKAMMTDNDSALKVQEGFGFSCLYEKPQLQELATPLSIVRGGSHYDLGDHYNEGEKTTEE